MLGLGLASGPLPAGTVGALGAVAAPSPCFRVRRLSFCALSPVLTTRRTMKVFAFDHPLARCALPWRHRHLEDLILDQPGKGWIVRVVAGENQVELLQVLDPKSNPSSSMLPPKKSCLGTFPSPVPSLRWRRSRKPQRVLKRIR